MDEASSLGSEADGRHSGHDDETTSVPHHRLLNESFFWGFLAGVLFLLAVGALVLLLRWFVRFMLQRSRKKRPYQPLAKQGRLVGGGAEDDSEEFELRDVEGRPLRRFVEAEDPDAVFVIDEDGEDQKEDEENAAVDVETLKKKSVTTAPKKLKLEATPSMDPQEFQGQWNSQDSIDVIKMKLKPEAADELESFLASHNISCMASGMVKEHMKLYLFAKMDDIFFLVEMMVSSKTFMMEATIKSEDPAAGQLFVSHLKRLLQEFTAGPK
ncbi:hypothetical protein QOT17_012460 [Balamuthia mandrillaris]